MVPSRKLEVAHWCDRQMDRLMVPLCVGSVDLIPAARITAGHINEMERLGMKYPYDRVRIVRGDVYAVVARDCDGKMAWGCKTHK